MNVKSIMLTEEKINQKRSLPVIQFISNSRKNKTVVIESEYQEEESGRGIDFQQTHGNILG